MLKKGLYIVLLINFVFPDAETWYTNPLDYVFSRTSNRMTFREPISFTPFDIKIGMFNYGGSDYWSQGFGSNDFATLLMLEFYSYLVFRPPQIQRKSRRRSFLTQTSQLARS